jgi:hypothetical protein
MMIKFLHQNKGELAARKRKYFEELTDDEYREVLIKTGNFRLGGWGHDIGPTDEDIIDMYNKIFNGC